MPKYEVKDHEPSYLPDGKKWKLVWSDEFDGTELDTTKWDYRLAMMGKRHITWDDEGVKLDGKSNAVFSIYEKDGKICSSQLETGHNYMDGPVGDGYTFDGGLKWPIGKLRPHKFLKKYGYFECRCKLQQKRGWWSAFWLQSPVIGCSLDAGVAGIENDILESFEPAKAPPTITPTAMSTTLPRVMNFLNSAKNFFMGDPPYKYLDICFASAKSHSVIIQYFSTVVNTRRRDLGWKMHEREAVDRSQTDKPQ